MSYYVNVTRRCDRCKAEIEDGSTYYILRAEYDTHDDSKPTASNERHNDKELKNIELCGDCMHKIRMFIRYNSFDLREDQQQ